MERATILLIDDSPTDIAIQAEALRAEHQVVCATSAESAFETMRSGVRPDLVVLDVVMPDADGLSVCRRLKADDATAAIPVIFVTARDGDNDEEAGFSAGGVDYVVKPVNPHLLRARVRTHIELKRMREDLEKQNEALRKAARLREEVEQINRHDLKNPLMVIPNIPEVLMRQPAVTTEQKQWLEMIESAGRKMLEMINRSIDLLKMEKGVYPLEPVDVDALVVARQVVSAVTPLALDRGVMIDLRIDGRPAAASDVFIVQGEEMLLYSMLSNLVRNAVEAAPAGSTASISLSENGTAAIAIHNEGAIPTTIRGRFFEKFATAGKKGGTGLGAYSARLIAATLGGVIACASSEREGTTITVRLARRPA